MKCLMNNLHEPPGFFLFFHSHPLIASLLSFLSFTHLSQTFPFVSFPRWSHSFCPNDVVKGMNGNEEETYYNCNFPRTLTSSALERSHAGVINVPTNLQPPFPRQENCCLRFPGSDWKRARRAQSSHGPRRPSPKTAALP